MPTMWVDQILSMAVASGAQGIQQTSPALADLPLRLERFTAIRTIIGIDIGPTVRDPGEGDQLVTLGIGVVTQEALVANVVPDPNSATDFPQRGWMWRARYRVYAVAVDDQNVARVRVDLDLRSQRKVENGKVVLIVNNDANLGVATSITVHGVIRMLFRVG